MAKNIYTQHYVDGTSKDVRRFIKQGRRFMSPELKRAQTITIHTTQRGKERFLEEQKKSSMSQSSFGDLVLFLGLEQYKQLFESNNCSTQ